MERNIENSREKKFKKSNDLFHFVQFILFPKIHAHNVYSTDKEYNKVTIISQFSHKYTNKFFPSKCSVVQCSVVQWTQIE